MNRLWYKKAASCWNEALPIGNGFMGAMIFGGTAVERIGLNEDSVWYGGFRDRVNPDAKRMLPEIRRLLAEDKISEAQELAELSIPGTPDGERHYEPLCDLIIQQLMDGPRARLHGMRWLGNKDMSVMEVPVQDYCRELTLEDGLHRVSYRCKEKEICRETLLSGPHRVLAVQYQGYRARVLLRRSRYLNILKKIDERTILLSGTTGDQGVHYAVMCRAVGDGVQVLGNTLLIPETCTLYAAAATSYRYEDPESQVLEWLDQA